MNKYSIALSLAILCSCSSTAISKEVIELNSKVITAETPKIIELAIEKEPYDIWERIRVDLTLTIPEYQIAATSVYSERLYSNQTAVNRISKSGQRYLFHTLSRAQELNLPVELALLPFVESEFNPYAKSVDGATGIWQFLPATGKE